MKVTAIALALLLAFGCESSQPFERTETDGALFGPAAMRVHPIFTQIKDWSGDGRPDGIEALVELQDQFGDPTKASGRVIFELFDYQRFSPERRGERLFNPWIGELETLSNQKDRWNRTSRTYGFQLASAGLSEERSYVLTAEFQLAGGGRFFDRIILEGQKPSGRDESPSMTPSISPTRLEPARLEPAKSPTNEPAARTPQP